MKLLLLFSLSLILPLCAADSGEALFNKVDASVVSIQHEEAGGSGFVISKDGYILTNGHVISLMDRENPKDVARRITVVFNNESKYQAKVIGFSLDPDVALIKIEPRNELQPVRFGDSSKVKTGQECYAFGAPFGLKRTLTKGIVSNTAQTSIGTFTKVIQTDAAINPGNSGGPLFNTDGEVIGINTYAKKGTGLGFSIPIKYPLVMIDHFKRFGYFRRAEVPLIFTKAMTEELARVLQAPQGIFIDHVVEGSLGEKAGFQASDIIIKMNGKKVDGSSEEAFYDFNWDFVTQEIDSTMQLTVLRRQKDGQYKEKVIKAKMVEDDPMPASGYQIGELPEILYPEIGIGVQRITSYVQYIYNLKNTEAVRVSSVNRSKSSGQAGIRKGDSIKKINNRSIHSDQEFKLIMDQELKNKTKFLIVDIERGNDIYKQAVRVHYPLENRQVLLVHDDSNDEYLDRFTRRMNLAGAQVTSCTELDDSLLEKSWDGIIVSRQSHLALAKELLINAGENKSVLGLIGDAPVLLIDAPEFYKDKKFTMDKEKSPMVINANLRYTGQENEVDGKLVTSTGFDKKAVRRFIEAFKSLAAQAR